MAALDRLRKRQAEILDAAARHGAHSLRAFGSVVRRNDTEVSYIDLLAGFDAGGSPLDLAGLKQDLESHLEFRTDALTETALGIRLREDVLAEARFL